MPVENITIENKLIRMKEKENSQKEKIIKQKMETLFGYKELSISVKEFKKQITGIMQDNKKISDIEEKYNHKEQKELIEKHNININTEINNLNKLYLSNTKSNIEDIVSSNNRITEMYVNLRKHNDTIPEMQFLYNNNGSIISKIVHKSIHLYNNENTIEPFIKLYSMKPINTSTFIH